VDSQDEQQGLDLGLRDGGPRDADGGPSAAGQPASACSLHQDGTARCGTDSDATGQATCGDRAANVDCDDGTGAEPERIEAISTLAEAERYLRTTGWSRSRSRAFVARIRGLRDEASTLDAIEQLLGRRTRSLKDY
jgi:hypothetical protein